MKITKIMKAYQALCKVSTQELPYSTAHDILIAKHTLYPHVQFFSENEMKIAQKYAEKEDGKIKITDGGYNVAANVREDCVRELMELSDVDVEFTPVTVHVKANFSISVDDLEALEGVIKIADD